MRLTSIIFIAFGFLTSALWGQTAEGAAEGAAKGARPVTLSQCMELALAHNLEIQIERYKPQSIRYSLQSEYGAYDPVLGARAGRRFSSREGGVDPDTGLPLGNTEEDADVVSAGLSGRLPTGLTYDFTIDVTEGNQTRDRLFVDEAAGITNITRSPAPFSQGQAGFVELSQPLLRDLWIDSTRLRIKQAKRDLGISELGFALLVMDVVTRVQQDYYELSFARENVVVQLKAVELAERLHFEAKKKVEVGTLAPLEQKRTESEVARAQASLIEAEYQVKFWEKELKGLLIDDYAEWSGVDLQPVEKLEANPYPSDIADNWLTALAQRPDYAQQLLQLEKAEILTKFTRNQLFPRLDAYGSYTHTAFGKTFNDALNDFSRGNTPNHFYGLRFSMPLSRRAERNDHKSAMVAREQRELEVKQLEQTILFQIEDAVNRVKSAYASTSATRQARVYAEAALEAEQKKFDSGRSTLSDVLTFQRDLTAARSAEIRALADYNQALSNLQFRQGNTLREQRIDLEFLK